MTSNRDKLTTEEMYKLTCTDCAFETTVGGSLPEALDAAEEHQTKNGEIATTHFVDILKTADE